MREFQDKILVNDHWVESNRYPGSLIHVRRKRINEGSVPLIFLHGLSFAPDLNQPDSKHGGISAADILAQLGYDVYLVCALGYGLSGRPNGNTNDFQDWYHDIIDVMTWLSCDQIDLIGCSSSAISALMVAAKHPEKIRTLIIHGIPNMTPDLTVYDPRPDTHWTFDISRIKHKRYRDIPDSERETVLPSSWYDDWESRIREQMPFDIPLGTEIDRVMIKLGEKKLSDYFDPSDVTSDCLFVTGEWDAVIDRKESYSIFKSLSSRRKKFRLAPRCSHWGLIETTRMNMIDIIHRFLSDTST